MKITVFSGTTEGRIVSRILAEEGHEVTVSVVSGYGREMQGTMPGIRVLTGPKLPGEVRRLLVGQDLLIDATHPYAAHITETLRQVTKELGIPYRRLLRPAGKLPEGLSEGTGEEAGEIRFAGSAAEAAALLNGTEGNILLTTGSKELYAYRGIPRERLVVRVLPSGKALESCERENIPHRNIIAMQGPFREELNRALIHQFQIRWLVTKDGGSAGGFEEKIRAARSSGCGIIVIRRPEDRGLSMESILKEVRKGIE